MRVRRRARKKGKKRTKKFRCIFCGQIMSKAEWRQDNWVCPVCGLGNVIPREH